MSKFVILCSCSRNTGFVNDGFKLGSPQGRTLRVTVCPGALALRCVSGPTPFVDIHSTIIQPSSTYGVQMLQQAR
jgi:hypothetical protein